MFFENSIFSFFVFSATVSTFSWNTVNVVTIAPNVVIQNTHGLTFIAELSAHCATAAALVTLTPLFNHV